MHIKNNDKPFFSIITVVLNNQKNIKSSIRSVKRQSFKNFEYIVIDGGSSDNTLKIIEQYKKSITKFITEKDLGIYDAFNKGMKLAEGSYLCFVNSDDILKKNALEIIKNYLIKNPKIDFIFGSVKKHWGIVHGYKPKKISYSWGFYSSHSTGFYIKRTSAQKVGFYNLKYKYHADYDYFYRMIVKHKLIGMSTKKNEIVGIFRRGGFSSTIQFRKLFFEELLIRYNNKQSFFIIIVIFIYKFFKHFNKLWQKKK